MLWQLKSQTRGLELPFKAPYSVTYTFNRKGKITGDIDNLMASINDILEEANVIENDKYIYEVYAKIVHGKENVTVVKIVGIN